MKRFLIIMGILLSLNALLLFFTIFNISVFFLLACGLGLMAHGLFFTKKKWPNRILIAFETIYVLTAVFLAVMGNIDTVTYRDEDCVMVLGAGLNGETVTLPLARRLDKAAEIYHTMPELKVIVTGGQGPNEGVAESEAMERYLIRKGIPSEMILQEDRAASTAENIEYSKIIMEENGLHKAIIVTNDFHIFRANSLAKKAGISSSHVSARTDWYLVPVNYAREVIAVFRMWIFF